MTPCVAFKSRAHRAGPPCATSIDVTCEGHGPEQMRFEWLNEVEIRTRAGDEGWPAGGSINRSLKHNPRDPVVGLS